MYGKLKLFVFLLRLVNEEGIIFLIECFGEIGYFYIE